MSHRIFERTLRPLAFRRACLSERDQHQSSRGLVLGPHSVERPIRFPPGHREGKASKVHSGETLPRGGGRSSERCEFSYRSGDRVTLPVAAGAPRESVGAPASQPRRAPLSPRAESPSTHESYLAPRIRQGYPLNLSISISGGKETNRDCLSNGE